ncbi:MAG: lysophospholipase [Erysipelotrichaceae bacterium]|nr:lysophospholipase [Erysipelotrichaceae bacterium]
MERTISSFDDTKLYLKTEVPENAKAITVIVHGLAEHQGRYDFVAQKLHEAGYGTYRFDHRGHGRSEGERTFYSDFNELLDDTNVVVDLAFAENPGLPIFLIGHSMGGFTCALYGVKYADKGLKGIVLSGALTADAAGIIITLPADQDPHTKLPNQLGAGVCSVAEVVDWYGKDPYNCQTFTLGLCYALRDGIAWFAPKRAEFQYPVFMMHGEKDGLVSTKDTTDFFALCPSKDKQMKIYGNLFHEIFNEYCKDEVVGDAIAWLNRRV